MFSNARGLSILAVVIGENNELLFTTTTTNTAIVVWLMGRERAFEPSERTA